MRELVDTHYPKAEQIRVVLVLRRLEFHYTPKHASWFNMVEIDIGVLRGQCLDRRIGDRKRLVAEIAAWERQRNAARAKVKWMFTHDGTDRHRGVLVDPPSCDPPSC
jgi:hypothetical protein